MHIETPLSEQIMQQIAFENNLAETAFVFQEGKLLRLRWFYTKNLKLICADTPHWQQLLFG